MSGNVPRRLTRTVPAKAAASKAEAKAKTNGDEPSSPSPAPRTVADPTGAENAEAIAQQVMAANSGETKVARPEPQPEPPVASTPTVSEQGANEAALPALVQTDLDASMQASKHASADDAEGRARDALRNGQDGPSVSLAALLSRPQVDPDEDLITVTLRVPKYVAEALRTTAFMARSSQQDIATRGIKAILPPELLEAAYKEAKS